MNSFKFEPRYIGERLGAGIPDAAMSKRRAAMNKKGEALSKGALTKPYPVGPGESEWVLPKDCSRNGAVLFLHGSGYSKGSPSSHRPLVKRIVEATGLPALVSDYRLAPEYRYPAALEDAVAVYIDLLSLYPSDNIAVIGDSAGGGLAIATILAARDCNLPVSGAVVTMSAWTDLAVTGTPADDIDDPIVTAEMLRSAAAFYLDGADAKHPYASPLYAEYNDFPPLLMQVGAREIMIEDTRRLVEKAIESGVLASQEVYPDMSHVFQLNQIDHPSAQRAIDSVAKFLNENLNVEHSS